jgi:2'-5' RNA ligase
MQAIVTLLDAAASSRIEAIWRMLEIKCGLKGIKKTPYPHFSWQGAAVYPQPEIETILQRIAQDTRPFKVKTSGLGIFTGRQPVIYAAIVKNEPLMRFHEKVWQTIQTQDLGVNAYYAPDAWIPHITLAYGDVNPTTIDCAMQELAFQPFEWGIQVDNLALVGQLGEDVGQLFKRFDFMDDTHGEIYDEADS